MSDVPALLPMSSQKVAAPTTMSLISDGAFWMGSDRHYSEEAPEHQVWVSGFWIDQFPVTNQDFAQFIQKTGYVTFAEIRRTLRAIQGPCQRCCMPGRRCS